ncbi:MAG: hypothetical protein M3Q45_05330, partial [Chloroflexota bacterium]|nr:hypothetical protein [Chloroflexota bacterium]
LKVIVIGAVMPLVYWLGIVLPYPLAFGLANPRGTWVKTGEGSFSALTLQIGVYLLLTLLYVAALRVLAPVVARTAQRVQVGGIWLSWALCSLALLFAAPNGESHDIYDYVFRGRMMDRFAASPLIITPNAYPHAPFYRYVAWQRHVDTYGPLWEYVSAATAKTVRMTLEWTDTFAEQLPSCPQSAVACQTLAAYLTGYRLLAILLTGISGLLLYGIVGATQPALGPLALATWLWNPLLLIATALGAHNDALMLLLLFLTYWLWQRDRWLAGWLAIGLAAQVKLTVLLLVPALGLWLVRKLGWLHALAISLLAVSITLVLSWALYAPLGGWATLPRMLQERQLFVAHSLAQILYFLLYKWLAWPHSLVRQMMVSWATWLFLAAAALLLLRTFKPAYPGLAPSPSKLSPLYRTCTLLTLLYLLVGSFWFQPWYLVWVLAPAALWIDGCFARQGLPWGCCGALCSNVVYDHLTQLPTAAEPDTHLYRLGVTVLVVMTIWLPLFIAQGVGARKQYAHADNAEPLGRATRV